MTRNLFLALVIIVGFVSSQALTCDAQSQGNKRDKEAIRKVIAGTAEAFIRHDAKAFTSFYSRDAELVTVRGERMKGVVEIEKGLGMIFATRAKGVALRELDMTVRFIRPDVAVVHVTNELSGLVSPEGEKLPPQRELSIRVLVKEKGRWLVTAIHNTIVRPFEPQEPIK